MTPFESWLLGVFIGGALGVLIMALLTISKER